MSSGFWCADHGHKSRIIQWFSTGSGGIVLLCTLLRRGERARQEEQYKTAAETRQTDDTETDRHTHTQESGNAGILGKGRRPTCRGLMDKLNGLNVWCKLTVMPFKSCGLGVGGGRTKLVTSQLTETLRLNTTVNSFDPVSNGDEAQCLCE